MKVPLQNPFVILFLKASFSLCLSFILFIANGDLEVEAFGSFKCPEVIFDTKPPEGLYHSSGLTGGCCADGYSIGIISQFP